MTRSGYQYLANEYAHLLADILGVEGAAEDSPQPVPLGELAIQELWDAGLLGTEGTTAHHGSLRILDHGTWNRMPGPDFLGAEIELNGQRLRGDIEIDPSAQDWERHGHGASVRYNRVILHVVLEPPPPGWYTRTEQHTEVPVFYLQPERIRRAVGLAPALDREQVHLCHTPLSNASVESIKALLQAAAAHRITNKRKRFHRKTETLGLNQAWYEAWAEALGYSANKSPMVALARRAPLSALGNAAEPILLGTAGFLLPVLPDAATQEARYYHRRVWDSWWLHKERFTLGEGRTLPWSMAGQRPMNHPHRRVAALAVSTQHWSALAPLLTAEKAHRAEQLLLNLRHDFWDFHCTFNSRPFERRAALIGRERIRDFLVNSVYTMDTTPGAWESYLQLSCTHPAPSRVQRTAKHLFGERADLAPLLRCHFAHQALLQIEADFCTNSTCRDCLFPHQLGQWCQAQTP